LNKRISSIKAQLATSTEKIATLEHQNSETEQQLKQEAQARLAAEAAKRQAEQALLESQNVAQARNSDNRLWTILASLVVGSLATLLAIRAPTFWSQKSNVAPKLSSLARWERLFQRKKSSPEASGFVPELEEHLAHKRLSSTYIDRALH
jgi:hypothetical protein